MWVLAILGLGVLVIVHEGGHYLVARWCGMRVERFAIGFGPPILKYKSGETQIQLGPIPFGGFVQITGMNPHEEFDEADPYVYPNRPTWQRFLTIFAGPGTNYLFAVLLFFAVFAIAGARSDRSTTEVDVVPKEGAAYGLLQPGDHILSINGEKLTADTAKVFAQFTGAVQEKKGGPVTLVFSHNGAEHTAVITPKLEKSEDKTKPDRYLVGIGFVQVRQEMSIGQSATAALVLPVQTSGRILSSLYRIVTLQEKPDVRGPVGIVGLIQQGIAAGWIRAFMLLAFLNVSLGLFNLLPLPALDGGRLAFLGYELITRRRPNAKFEAAVHMFGFALLFLLILLVTYKDISKYFS